MKPTPPNPIYESLAKELMQILKEFSDAVEAEKAEKRADKQQRKPSHAKG